MTCTRYEAVLNTLPHSLTCIALFKACSNKRYTVYILVVFRAMLE